VFKAILKKLSPVVTEPRTAGKQEPEVTVVVGKKPYSRPEATQLGAEQGILLLVGRAWTGDSGARELLELIFPEHGGKHPSTSKIDKVSKHHGKVE
jgi:hypothetical protein